MTELSGGEAGKEIEVRRAGRPPELDASARPESQNLALLLRRCVFGPLRDHGYGFREIRGALGDGYSTATVSRISRAVRVPTFVELSRLMELTEGITKTSFGLEQRMAVQTAHLAALKATKSSLYELFMAEQACQAYQLECERLGGIEREQRDELVLAHRLLYRARCREAVERASAARLRQERDRMAARLEAARSAVEEEQTSAVLEVAARRAEIAPLRQALARAEALSRQAGLQLAGARRELAQAQERLQAEIADGQAVAEELRVVTATLQQVRAERDALREEESRRAVLDEADAAVRRAQREMSQEEALVGGATEQGSADSEDAVLSEELLQAALFGSEEELADLLADLGDRGDGQAMAFVLDAAASRPAAEIGALLQALGEAGYWQYKEQLLRCVAELPAASVVELLGALEDSEALTDIGLVFDAAALGDVRALVRYLLHHDLRVYGARLLDAAVRRRPVRDVVAFLAALEEDGRRHEADGVVRDAATHRSPRDVLALLSQIGELPEASRYVGVALAAASVRKPQAIAALYQQLLLAEREDFAGTLLDHTSLQAVSVVADTIALLAAGSADDRGLCHVVASFVHHRGELTWQLLVHLVPRSHTAVAHTLRVLGTVLPVEHLAPLAQRTADSLPSLVLEPGQQEQDSAEILLGGAATRDPAQIAGLAQALDNLSRRAWTLLLTHALNAPPPDAARTVATLMAAGMSEDQLIQLAITAVPHLDSVLALASALEATSHRRLRHQLVRAAGACPSFSALSVADALRPRRPGWLAQALLEGVALRHKDLLAEQALQLHRNGQSPYVQLLLVAVAAQPDAATRVAAALWDRGLGEDALWLWTRHAETSSVDQLAAALCSCPAGSVAEFIRCCVQVISGSRAALLIDVLARRRSAAHLALAVLAEGARAMPAWILACADALDVAQRVRQAGWLRQHAQSPDDAPMWPPPETAAEAVSATSRLYGMGQSALADEMLAHLVDSSSTMRTGPQISMLDLLGLLNQLPQPARQPLLEGIVDLPHLVDTATPEYIAGLLQFLTQSPALRARLFALPTHDQSGHVLALLAAMNTLNDDDPVRQEILDVSVSIADKLELTAIARRTLAGGNTQTAHHLIWHALRRRPLADLPPLVRLAVAHNLATRQTIHAFLQQAHRSTEHDILACLDEAFRPEFHLQIARDGRVAALRIPPHLHEMIVLHVLRALPGTACGVIVGPRATQRLTNCLTVTPAPELPVLPEERSATSQNVTEALLRDGEEIKAVYYSVSAAVPYPSPADIARVTPSARHYLIVTHTGPRSEGQPSEVESIRAFTLHGDTIHEKKVLVAPEDPPPFNNHRSKKGKHPR
ncbi:hypothetical protein ACH4MW_36780 [Streptomyces luteogriseus]|uniref:hypothetical protein n=1 Tax=Streptomyces luteogriseus TaxID=68233 RepID=UPI00379AE384